MTKHLFSIGIIATMAVGITACTSFESGQTLTLTSPSVTPSSSSTTTGPFVGDWASLTNLPVPSVSTCSNFEWQIAGQTDTSVSGSFIATCAGGLSITATASGVLTTPTTVAMVVTGVGIVSGFPICNFSLSGTRTIVDNNTLTIPYDGTTCVGPVHGTETLRRHVDPPPAPPAPPEPPAPDPLPPADTWTNNQWHDYFLGLLGQKGFSTTCCVTVQALQATRPDLNAHGADWQHDSFGNLRPRIYLATSHGGPLAGDFSRPVDVGGWEGPWVWFPR